MSNEMQISDNLSATVDDYDYIYYDTNSSSGSAQHWAASSFFTGANAVLLRSVSLYLRPSSPALRGAQPLMQIYTDSSGLPGNPIDSLSGPDQIDHAGSYPFFGSIALQPNSQYWIVAKALDNRNAYDVGVTSNPLGAAWPDTAFLPTFAIYDLIPGAVWQAIPGLTLVRQVTVVLTPMPSSYLVPGDFVLYGIDPDTVTQQDVQAASAIIDGWLQRPAGCVYTLANSVPTAMAATGQPLVETRRVPQKGVLPLGYAPLSVVQKVEQLQNGVWVTLSGWLSYETSEGQDTGAAWLDLTRVAGLIPAAPVRTTYVAGWTYATLPAAIKQACANLLLQPPDPDIPLNIARVRAGDTEIERQLDTPFDPATAAMLRPYRRVFA